MSDGAFCHYCRKAECECETPKPYESIWLILNEYFTEAQVVLEEPSKAFRAFKYLLATPVRELASQMKHDTIDHLNRIADLESELQKANEKITVLEKAIQSRHDYGTASPGEQEAAWILYCQATGWNPSEHPAAKNAFCEGFCYGDMFSQGDEGRAVLRAERLEIHDNSELAIDRANTRIVGLEQELQKAREELAEISNDARLFVPGQWECPKCKFSLSRTTLNVSSGTAGTTAADREETEACPNDGTMMIRESWEQRARFLMQNQDLKFTWLGQDHERLEQQVQELREALRNEKTMYAKLLLSFRWAENEMQRLAKAALKLPRPWMDGSIEFDEWIEAMDRVLAALKKAEGR